MKLFIIVSFLGLILVLGGFELFQHLSIRAGQIPARGIHTWMGKPFLHWNDFWVQKVGDLVFLSGLYGLVAVGLTRVRWTTGKEFWVAVVIALAIIATILWLRSTQAQFSAGKFSRWDWGFTAPEGRLTIAGKFHVGYFALGATAIGLSLLFLLWMPIGLWIRISMGVCVIGYAVTAVIDALSIGLSGGPFAGPKLQ